MVKRFKNQKNEKETKQYKQYLNISSIIKGTKYKIIPKNKNTMPKINSTILFKIEENPLKQIDFEAEYYKRYLFYIKEEFNSKIITMFFNYISFTNIIPNSFKNNRYFLKEFFKIIVELLINEIDLVIITLIFDVMGWIKEGSDPWIYIYYICLYAKHKSSSDNSFIIMKKILDKNNIGFENGYNNWVNNTSNKKKLEKVDVIKTNERFEELMKPIYLKEKHKKYINYNEIVNQIISMTKQRESLPVKTLLNNKNNIILTNNNILPNTNIFLGPLDVKPNRSERIINNILELSSKQNQQSILDFQPISSFNNEKFFDLSLNGSRNNSFMGLSSKDGEIYKLPSTKFNNK